MSTPIRDRDAPEHFDEVATTLARKRGLRLWYREIYRRMRASLDLCPSDGLAIELGAGGGFACEVMPELIATDIQAAPGIDLVADATALPFADGSLRFLCMLNVFHHIADPSAFLHEATRALRPGGRMLIADQHLGLLSRPIFRFLHDEHCDPGAQTWSFASSGPRSGANGALAHIVFRRDQKRFAQDHPELQLLHYQPHSPLRYWLTGGLKSWTLLPRPLFKPATLLDRSLAALSHQTCSFVHIELRRT